MKDSLALKKAPETFEQLRSHYPLRREFCAYSLQPDSEARKLEAWVCLATKYTLLNTASYEYR